MVAMVHRSNIHYSEIHKKENSKNIYFFLWNYKKAKTPGHLVQLSILMRGQLDILGIDTQLNS